MGFLLIRDRRLVLAIGLALVAALPSTATAATSAHSSVRISGAEAKCQSYLGRVIEGATITRARLRPAAATVTEACVVRGEMSKDLDFEVVMPTQWNMRTVFAGGGGFDGAINSVFISGATVGAGGIQPDSKSGAYAVISSNHGHNANVTPGATFALDVEMFSDYAYLGVPRTLAPAKALLRLHYGPAFERGKLVYEGCSGGGRQGLIQAQRYPDLFDGIISRAPANAYVPQFLWYNKLMRFRSAPGGELSPAQGDAIGTYVRAKCDVLDGLKDGIISRPDVCKFDPAELACKKGESGGTCLTPPQIATARAYYEPTNVLDGTYTWPGFMPGGESAQSWGLGSASFLREGAAGLMNYMLAQDPEVDQTTMDLTKYRTRLGYLSAALDAVDPDLSRFRASGGKLLLWTGQADWLITANNATSYYQSVVEKAGGQAAADEFVEYYTSPDVQHCALGAGPDKIDLVTPMFEWLEKGVKPSSKTIVASQMIVPKGTLPVTRPLCRFPRYPKYIGGDQNSAASFSCELPAS